MEISDSDGWRCRNPTEPRSQNSHEGAEVRSLLPTERLEEMEGYQVVTDINADGVRYIKFWVDASPESNREEEVDFQQTFDGHQCTTNKHIQLYHNGSRCVS